MRPRVTLVVASLGPGGAENVLTLLANDWARRGCEVTLLCFDPDGTRPYRDLEANVRLEQLGETPPGRRHPLRRGIWTSVRRVLVLREAIVASRPDVVLSFLTKINVLTLLATRRSGLPVVVSERNNPQRQDLRATWAWLRDRLYPSAAAIVCQTEGARQALPEPVRRRVWVIPNPVGPTPAARRRRDCRVVTAVGRLVHQKGFDLLLQAFAEVAKERADWSLVIWGDGPDREALEALRDKFGLRDRVTLPGLTGRPRAWVEEAAIFVLSSRYEGFSNVLVEAMASGLAVLAFDCPWSPDELITHEVDGLLVPPEDVKALAAALRRLSVEPGLRLRLGDAARRKAARFDSDRVIPMWDQVLTGAAPALQLPAPSRHVVRATSP
jgi:glycosyltransferase involved in cell wall biosynthesis